MTYKVTYSSSQASARKVNFLLGILSREFGNGPPPQKLRINQILTPQLIHSKATMAPLQHGKGATASVFLLKDLHDPKKVVGEKFPNARHKQRLDGYFELEQKGMPVNGLTQVCILLRHEDFKDLALHALKPWVKVTRGEGQDDEYFERMSEDAPVESLPKVVDEEGGEERRPIPEKFLERLTTLQPSAGEDSMSMMTTNRHQQRTSQLVVTMVY
jgi:hypothetical protein